MSIAPAQLAFSLALLGFLPVTARAADPIFFSTGDPNDLMATATRPDSPGKAEIESADDFVLTKTTSITGATFTGLLPAGAIVQDVVVEIYRVFPLDSSVPPSGHVLTRLNSPSDVAFEERDTGSGLTFSTTLLNASFTATNSVTPGGINPFPNQRTGGDGPQSGQETEFQVTLSTPFTLPADHYFFVPQVQLDNGDFLWLSAPKPIVPPGTQFPSGFTDLQSWTRDAALDPDWSRVGTDIVGGTPAPTFNEAFSLSGSVVPEPSTWAMMLLGFAGLGFAGYRHARKTSASSA
jgi:hypothetical protein